MPIKDTTSFQAAWDAWAEQTNIHGGFIAKADFTAAWMACEAIKDAEIATLPRLIVRQFQPGQWFETKGFGRARFLRWDTYLGQVSAKIETEEGDICYPFPEALQKEIDEFVATDGAKHPHDFNLAGMLRLAVTAQDQAYSNEYIGSMFRMVMWNPL